MTVVLLLMACITNEHEKVFARVVPGWLRDVFSSDVANVGQHVRVEDLVATFHQFIVFLVIVFVTLDAKITRPWVQLGRKDDAVVALRTEVLRDNLLPGGSNNA